MQQTEAPARADDALPLPAATSRRTIRVLHCVGHLARGGIETWLYQMIQRLDCNRFEHDVLVWTDQEEAFTAQFRAAGVRVLPCTGHGNPVRLAQKLARIVRDHGPYDVLHTHGSHGHAFVMLFARAAGIRALVAHSHTDVRPVLRGAGLGYRLYAAIGNQLMRRLAVAGVGVTGEAAESLFGPRWSRNPKLRVLHCGVDLRPFREAPDPGLRGRLGIPDGRVIIGHVGRFEPQKNHAFLIELADEIARRGSNLHFLLIGDGSLRAGFAEATSARGLGDRFTILDDCRTVAAHMVGAMDGFICPSLFEGLPLVLMEAQAAGLPCLVSEGMSDDVAVVPGLIKRLALSHGVSAWADALATLPAQRIDNRDPALRQTLNRSSFNVEASAAGLAQVYETALAPGTARQQPRNGA